MGEKYVYIENVHNAPITCVAKDKDGKVLVTKKFYYAMNDKWSGKQITTGFEKLTEEEYNLLCKYSKGFIQYKDNPKKTMPAPLLIVHEELPPEAKAPHEALADARKESRRFAEEVKNLEGQITKLKAKLLDEETKYKTLQSASTNEEKLKPLNNQIAELKAQYGNVVAFVESLIGSLEKTATNDKAVQTVIKSFSGSFAKLTGKKDFE